MKDAVIVSAARTPVGKAKRGGLATVRPDEMAATVIQELLKRTPNLDPAQIEDVVIGCAFPEGEQGLNMARMISRSEEHTSELQSPCNLVCRLLLEKKK